MQIGVAAYACGGAGLLLLFASAVITYAGPFDGEDAKALQRRLAALVQDTSEATARSSAHRERLAEIEAETAAVHEEARRYDDEEGLLDVREAAATVGAQRTLAEFEDRIAAMERNRSAIHSELEGLVEASDPKEVIRNARMRVIAIHTDLGLGSGFILSPQGWAITNYHVIEGSTEISVDVKGVDGKGVTVEGVGVVAVDPTVDLALLQLPPAPAAVGDDGKYPALGLRTGPTVGEDVYAIGNPGAGARILEDTVTRGIISSTDRQIGGVSLIQTSAPINPGNSGGPLLDRKGKVVGVIVSKIADAEGVAFAVPSASVTAFVKRRDKPPCAVKEGLPAWEAKNNPIAAVSRRQPGYDPGQTVELECPGTALVVSPRSGDVFILQGSEGRIAKYSPESKTLAKVFKGDRLLTGLCSVSVHGREYLLASSLNGEVLRVDCSDMRLVDVARVGVALAGIRCIGDSSRWVVPLPVRHAALGPTMLLPWKEMGKAPARRVALPGPRRDELCAFGSRLVALRGDSVEVWRSEALTMLKRIDSSTEALRRSRSAAGRMQLSSTLSALRAALTQKVKTISIVGERIVDRLFATRMLRAGRNLVIVRRRLYDVGFRPRLVRQFEPIPALSGLGAHAEGLAAVLGEFHSVDATGRWAADCLHIYDVRTGKAVRRLPFASSVHAFSPNGRSIYLLEVRANRLYFLRDWAKAASP
ncbi:MAG: S1C family serine protease [Planctomycetota bacterium]